MLKNYLCDIKISYCVFMMKSANQKYCKYSIIKSYLPHPFKNIVNIVSFNRICPPPPFSPRLILVCSSVSCYLRSRCRGPGGHWGRVQHGLGGIVWRVPEHPLTPLQVQRRRWRQEVNPRTGITDWDSISGSRGNMTMILILKKFEN